MSEAGHENCLQISRKSGIMAFKKYLLIPIAKLFYIASIDFSQLLKHFVNTDFKTKDVSRKCPSDGGLDYMVISMQFSGYVPYLSF